MIQDLNHFVVAHRGSSGTAPENTMASIKYAIDAGALMIEVDVQLTKDDQAIIIHDPVLGRTTNGNGYVRSQTFTEIQTLDAGSWFNASFSGEHVPLLSEALQLIQHHKRCVNIEIKPPAISEDWEKRLSIIIEQVQSFQMEDVTLFSSFHHESLRFINIHHSSLHTAAINIPNDKRLPSEIASDIGCEGFVCSLREITQNKSKDAANHNILVGVYTINTLEDFKKIMNYDISAIVSNVPRYIQQLLHSMKE